MTKQDLTIKHTLITLAKGSVIGIAVTLAVALISSISLTSLPAGAVATAAVIACLVGSATAAVYTTRKLNVLVLWFGLASGLLLFVTLYLIGALVFWRITPAANSLPIFLASICGGISGALLRNSKPKRRRR